mmetsp:Transcript_40473/g.72852  ORF Transcript_40473/g.72852 Transcript_40473/m.72852 type:complete len:126 (-) Transcript_40473:109-486(-)
MALTEKEPRRAASGGYHAQASALPKSRCVVAVRVPRAMEPPHVNEPGPNEFRLAELDRPGVAGLKLVRRSRIRGGELALLRPGEPGPRAVEAGVSVPGNASMETSSPENVRWLAARPKGLTGLES